MATAPARGCGVQAAHARGQMARADAGPSPRRVFAGPLAARPGARLTLESRFRGPSGQPRHDLVALSRRTLWGQPVWRRESALSRAKGKRVQRSRATKKELGGTQPPVRGVGAQETRCVGQPIRAVAIAEPAVVTPSPLQIFCGEGCWISACLAQSQSKSPPFVRTGRRSPQRLPSGTWASRASWMCPNATISGRMPCPLPNCAGSPVSSFPDGTAPLMARMRSIFSFSPSGMAPLKPCSTTVPARGTKALKSMAAHEM